MRILVVSQYYWPEPFNVSDICEELAKRGHEVTVLTGIPNYPEGRYYDGYTDGAARVEQRNAVQILRTTMRPRKSGAINRFLNYESFRRNASAAVLSLSGDFDVVFSYEVSPVMSADPALVYSKKWGKPCVIYVLDIWPECLLSGGIKKNSPIYNHYKKISRRIYGSADLLAVSSSKFEDYIRELGCFNQSFLYLPQYAEDFFCNCGLSDSIPRGYESEHTHLTFAGNIGLAQSVQTIIKAAALLNSSPMVIHIIGSGSELNACSELAKRLKTKNVMFHGRHDISEMPAYYQASDALIVSFADSSVLGYTLPRKIQTYLAAGKPVLGAMTGAAKDVIEESGCGLCCKAEDSDGLASIFHEFIQSTPEVRLQWGRNARQYYDSYFTKEAFFCKLENALFDVIKQ